MADPDVDIDVDVDAGPPCETGEGWSAILAVLAAGMLVSMDMLSASSRGDSYS